MNSSNRQLQNDWKNTVFVVNRSHGGLSHKESSAAVNTFCQKECDVYKISLRLLYKRSKKIIFATNILSKFVDGKTLKKTEFNFILKDLKYSKNKSKKKINLIVYYRKHENKFFDHHIEFIKEKLKKKERVIIVGDILNIEGAHNFGRIKKKKVINLIKISKYALSGDDNLLSFFNIYCIQNNVKVIFNYKLNFQKKRLNIKQFLPYNFEKKKFIK